MRKSLILLVFLALVACGSVEDEYYGCEKIDNDYPELFTYYCEGDEMAVRFVTPNLIDDVDNAEFSGSSEADGFPFENVKDARLTRRWRNTGVLVLDNMDLATGWAGGGEGDTPTVNTTTKQEGDASLNLLKSGTTGALADWFKTLTTQFDVTGRSEKLWIYIDDITAYANAADSLDIRIGNDVTKYYTKPINVTTEMSNGWNLIDEFVTDLNKIAGTVAAQTDFLQVKVTLVGNNAIAAGDLMIDFWRLSLATETIDIDLGSAQAVNTAIIDGHDLLAADTNIKVWWSDDEAAYTEAAEFTHDSGTMVEFFAATLTHRYWRFSYDPSSAATDADEIRNIGRLFLGVYTQPTRAQDLNRTIEYFDPSRMRRSRSQTVYGDVKNIWQRIKFKLKMEPTAGVDTLQALLKDLGNHTALWINLNQASPNGDNTVYGRLKKGFKRVDPLPTHGSMDFELEEDV